MRDKTLIKEIGINAQNIITALEKYQDDNVETLELDKRPITFADGGGYNGTVSKSCICIDGKEPEVIELSTEYTNNEMEYFAVIHAMIKAPNGSLILSDSQLIVEQCYNRFRCKEKKIIHLKVITQILMESKDINLKWIPRKENLAGKHLDKLK